MRAFICDLLYCLPMASSMACGRAGFIAWSAGQCRGSRGSSEGLTSGTLRTAAPARSLGLAVKSDCQKLIFVMACSASHSRMNVDKPVTLVSHHPLLACWSRAATVSTLPVGRHLRVLRGWRAPHMARDSHSGGALGSCAHRCRSVGWSANVSPLR